MKMQGSDVQPGPQCGSMKSQHHILGQAVPKEIYQVRLLHIMSLHPSHHTCTNPPGAGCICWGGGPPNCPGGSPPNGWIGGPVATMTGGPAGKRWDIRGQRQHHQHSFPFQHNPPPSRPPCPAYTCTQAHTRMRMRTLCDRPWAWPWCRLVRWGPGCRWWLEPRRRPTSRPRPWHGRRLRGCWWWLHHA